jgi:aspartate kinase
MWTFKRVARLGALPETVYRDRFFDANPNSSMSLVVQKFGGTCMGSPERIQMVSRRIARDVSAGGARVVVVSAMGKTTDDLLLLASQVSRSLPHREIDMLLTAGERISMALLSMALSDQGIAAVSLTGSQCGIVTDRSHRRARIRRILGDRARESLALGKVVIVAGFQGVSEEGKEITTLGRGGSDTTAVALAAVLGAERCDIYTDVDGVYSADPRQVQGAVLHEKISFDSMLELAARGAGVLHPRSVALARKFKVRLRVLNGLVEGDRKGTEVSEIRAMEDPQILGVTADEDRAVLSVELERAGSLGALWQAISQAQLSVLAPVFEGVQVRLFADKDQEKEWDRELQVLLRDGFIKSFAWDRNRVPVSLVGECFSQDSALLGDVVGGLAEHGIFATLGVASAVSVTIAVPQHQAAEAVRTLHERWIAKKGLA